MDSNTYCAIRNLCIRPILCVKFKKNVVSFLEKDSRKYI